jgi:hypothetical protein
VNGLVISEGSTDKALQFIDSNQSKIEYIIDEYVSFSNKMQGKKTLSEAEKLIQEQLKKQRINQFFLLDNVMKKYNKSSIS